MRPRVAVVEGELVVTKEAELERYLMVVRGSKGGRQRCVPVDTDAKRAAIAFACSVVRNENDSLCQPGYALKKAMRRFRHIVSMRLGVTLADVGVTPHGLRHDYANDRYERFAGAASPVRGGPGRRAVGDAAARQRVSVELGHWRPEVTSAYCGSSANPPTALVPSSEGAAHA